MASTTGNNRTAKGTLVGTLPPPMEEYFQGVRNRLDSAYANFRSVLENEYVLLHSFLSSIPSSTSFCPTTATASPPPTTVSSSTTSKSSSSSSSSVVVTVDRWNSLAARQERILTSLEAIEKRVFSLPLPQQRAKEQVKSVSNAEENKKNASNNTSSTTQKAAKNVRSANVTGNEKIDRTKSVETDVRKAALTTRQESTLQQLRQLMDRVSRLTPVTTPATTTTTITTTQNSAAQKREAPKPTTAEPKKQQQQQQRQQQQQQPQREKEPQKVKPTSPNTNDVLYYSVISQVKPPKPQV